MAEVYIVTVVSEGPSQVQLMFFREEVARKIYDRLVAKGRGEDDFEIEAEDDYGTRLMVNRDHVLTVQFCDMRRQREGASEAQLIEAMANALLQKKAMSDPALALLSRGVPANGMLRA